MSSAMIKTMSVARMFVGSSSLIAPRQIGPLFGLPVPGETTMMARLFGARDFVLGAYLWRAIGDWNAAQSKDYLANGSVAHQQSPNLKGAESVNTAASIPILRDEADRVRMTSTIRQHDLSTALWLGFICDSIDVASCIACIVEGNISDLGKVSAGLGAALLAAMGAYQLRTFKRAGRQEA